MSETQTKNAQTEAAIADSVQRLVGRPCEYITVLGKWMPCEVRPTPEGSKVNGIYIVADGVRYTCPPDGVRLKEPSNDPDQRRVEPPKTL